MSVNQRPEPVAANRRTAAGGNCGLVTRVDSHEVENVEGGAQGAVARGGREFGHVALHVVDNLFGNVENYGPRRIARVEIACRILGVKIERLRGPGYLAGAQKHVVE